MTVLDPKKDLVPAVAFFRDTVVLGLTSTPIHWRPPSDWPSSGSDTDTSSDSSSIQRKMRKDLLFYFILKNII